MALKALFKAKDQIPEAHRDLYKEVDGRFVLDVEGVEDYALENVGGLKRGLEGEREERRKLSERMKAFEGLDPATARTALEELEALKKLDPSKEADKIAATKIEAFKKGLVDEFGKKEAALTQRADGYAKKLGELLIDNDAILAIREAGGSPDLLLPIIKSQTRWRQTDDGKFVVEVFDPATGNARLADHAKNETMTIAHLVAEMRASERYGRAFDASGASGSGASSSGAKGGGAAHAVKSRADLKTDADKAAFIGKHGLEAFQKLPAK